MISTIFAYLYPILAVILAIILAVLQWRGYPVVSTLKTIALWMVGVGPFVTLIVLWIASGIQLIGFNALDWWVLGRLGLGGIHIDYVFLYFLSFAVFGWLSVAVGVFVVKVDGEHLLAKNPKTGETGVFKIPQEKWDNMRVVHHETDEELSKDALTTAPWYKVGMGWEATEYNPDTNVAKSSYFGDLTPSETRTHAFKIDLLMGELLDDVDAAYDADARRDRDARMDSKREATRIARDHEYATLPDGELPKSPLRERLDETDDTDNTSDETTANELYEGSQNGESGDSSSDLPTGGEADE
ncbi:hypothetical protein OB955_04790 [Halobacteria archaeon AArc-m2/3/4]|uniref:Uncharacterized protein n=1 Tax=Natronoglomus mannanivorans TaxID=2979990 RepID=A0ABT2QAU7_9EURY|nr:hypothetical protein [Halobacteria archaeon AArc-m2/3/4]